MDESKLLHAKKGHQELYIFIPMLQFIIIIISTIELREEKKNDRLQSNGIVFVETKKSVEQIFQFLHIISPK